MRRLRGLKALVVDAVEHGSRAVEKVQLDTARLPFGVLERIPEIAVPVKGIHAIHDAVVESTHGMIRLVARVAGETMDVILDAVEKQQAETPGK